MGHDIGNQLLEVHRCWRRFAMSLQHRSLDTNPAGKFPVPVAGQMTRPSSCARMQVAQSDIIRTVRTNCHMWEQDLCTPISIGWSTLYMEIKMKVDNYEVILNLFRQRWMNFFLFKELGSLLRKRSKRLFYCILLRLQSIQLLILESDISYTFTSK